MPHKLQFINFWHSLAWALVIGMIVLGIIPPKKLNLPIFPYADKLWHAAGYLVLMLWFSNLKIYRSLRLIISLTLLGTMIELRAPLKTSL